MKIKVGTRGSKLALTQTRGVIDKLNRVLPDIEFELKIIVTEGDRLQAVDKGKACDRGAFVKELEEVLMLGTIDIGVHCMEDIPIETTKGLIFTKSPIRDDPTDTLVTIHPIHSILDLPKNSVIATSNKRCSCQLKLIRPDIKTVKIIGNIENRIKKMIKGVDGILLSTACINTLKLNETNEYHNIRIPIYNIMPAPTQGILGIQIKEERKDLFEIMNYIMDPVTNIQLAAERSFLKGINKDINFPVGAYCEVSGSHLTLYGLFSTEDGSVLVKDSITGTCDQAEELGYQLANNIKNKLKEYKRLCLESF